MKRTGEFKALFGIIDLVSGPYLIFVEEAEEIQTPITAMSKKHHVYRAGSFKVIPVTQGGMETLGGIEHDDEKRYVQLLEQTLNGDNQFYYSPTMDLTQRTQALLETYKTMDAIDVNAETAERMFFWNHFASTSLMPTLSEWVVPFIRGFMDSAEVTVKGTKMTFGLLTRLSCARVGTRFNTRGIDKKGNAANYAETEQMIATPTDFISFLQVRGSVPVFWTQKATLKYEPTIIVNPNSNRGFNTHINWMVERYGTVSCTSLINQKGGEKKLHVAFDENSRAYAKTPDSPLLFVGYDYHKEYKKDPHLTKMLDQIRGRMKTAEYFLYSTTEGIKKRQKGVVRSNCKDCLDRTNVGKSVVGKLALGWQLVDLGLLSGQGDAIIESEPALFSTFRYIWADNGDAMSRLYAGTSALKRDYTRTGKRTLLGRWDDLCSSLKRYYLNNFEDGHKQDGLALLLGKYQVDPSAESPFGERRQSRVVYHLMISVLTTSIFFVMGNLGRTVGGGMRK
eukprot:CAMPEP_0117426772 /NCGR_PEP_ID=MMETSP0758-20121206/6795_1 /TAXON_ID=63605 /ORGANISM="Percolomonas cosmopolitus, Strain AE-1 (ATCC 50343)" /LENGTH=507 /DNA_ID=CAMNT_0005212093 /DNA_START=650 /DNA_END=2173 /DNA_ORIENTATION=+